MLVHIYRFFLFYFYFGWTNFEPAIFLVSLISGDHTCYISQRVQTHGPLQRRIVRNYFYTILNGQQNDFGTNVGANIQKIEITHHFIPVSLFFLSIFLYRFLFSVLFFLLFLFNYLYLFCEIKNKKNAFKFSITSCILFYLFPSFCFNFLLQ